MYSTMFNKNFNFLYYILICFRKSLNCCGIHNWFCYFFTLKKIIIFGDLNREIILKRSPIPMSIDMTNWIDEF